MFVDDIIWRQDAIDAVYKSSGTGTALKALRALPSAQQVQRKGWWIYHSDWISECPFECSECGMNSDLDYNYCMQCGAKMDRGEHDG